MYSVKRTRSNNIYGARLISRRRSLLYSHYNENTVKRVAPSEEGVLKGLVYTQGFRPKTADKMEGSYLENTVCVT